MIGRRLLANRTLLSAISAALIIAGFWAAYQFVEPAPPSKIVISTGNPDGAYYLNALRYEKLLARSHVTLDIRQSGGSIENIERLKSEDSDVDLAFVQGGVNHVGDDDTLYSIGSLYYEPIWLFYRNSNTQPVRYMNQLAGKTIAVGAQGSGTRPLALRLLEASGMSQEPALLSELHGSEAADALLAGEIDAAFFIAGAQSLLIRRLLQADDIALMDFAQAKAYTRLFPYLSKLTLPEGVFDLKQNIPPQETALIAATANLVVRPDLHPALIDLVLQAATQVHGKGGLFEDYGAFPSPKYLEFPLSEDAERFYQNGPSLLRRYLPFWVATLIERMLVMFIPVVAVLFPLFKVLPPLYQWTERSKIYRWYRAVKSVETRSLRSDSSETLEALHTELNAIENKASKTAVSLAYTDQLYNLRMHINLVRSYIDEELTKYDPKQE